MYGLHVVRTKVISCFSFIYSLGFVGRGKKTPEDMERENPSKEAVLITGGSGYFGFRLVFVQQRIVLVCF